VAHNKTDGSNMSSYYTHSTKPPEQIQGWPKDSQTMLNVSKSTGGRKMQLNVNIKNSLDSSFI